MRRYHRLVNDCDADRFRGDRPHGGRRGVFEPLFSAAGVADGVLRHRRAVDTQANRGSVPGVDRPAAGVRGHESLPVVRSSRRAAALQGALASHRRSAGPAERKGEGASGGNWGVLPRPDFVGPSEPFHRDDVGLTGRVLSAAGASGVELFVHGSAAPVAAIHADNLAAAIHAALSGNRAEGVFFVNDGIRSNSGHLWRRP
jgi:hypothetical protein